MPVNQLLPKRKAAITRGLPGAGIYQWFGRMI
jgi:hypothetical protein